MDMVSQLVLFDNSTSPIAHELFHKLNGEKKISEHGKNLQDMPTVDIIISFASDPACHSSEFLTRSWQALTPNGKLVLHEPLQGRNFTASEELSSRLLLTGFSDTKISSNDGMIEISSQKPEWSVGDSHKVVIKKPQATATWSLAANETELIDEDSLLTESDKYTRPSTLRDDCEVGAKGKKACKNCTCGRAEQENSQPKLTLDMLENPGVNSSCGSCGLGDAFRCAGCPYRGLPAFTVGEKVTIPASFLEDDI